METANEFSTVNMTGGSHTGLFSRSPYTVAEIVLILVSAGLLSLITVTGNILVMLSIKVNKNLQTVNNYFLFSLACADLFIGFWSMNFYAIYIVIDHWPLGELECDFWLTADYVVSNASVMNLLLISFDRYFCVTKPMTYPARRSTKMAGMMIAAAWILSFVLWTPLILSWQFIVGRRSVLATYCHCQFFSNPWVTFVASIIAFYLPLSIMAYLYWRIAKTSYNSIRRNSRRTSGSSLSEIVSFVQGEVNCTTTKQEKEETAAGKEKEMLQQHSSSGLFRESQADQTDAASETVKASTSKESKLIRSSSNVSDRNVSMRTLEKWRKRVSTCREKKVTRTIVAVMVAFIVTWTPYNMTVLVHALCNCVPKTLWSTLYWLCYVNSTINPACYALCNDTFKITFKHLLLCQYKNIWGRRFSA